jgi:hypothetical protein
MSSSSSELTNSVLPEPVIHTPLVRKKRSLQEEIQQQPTSSVSDSLSSHSATGNPPHKTPKVDREYDILDEPAAVMKDLVESKKLRKILHPATWKKLRDLMEKITRDASYKTYQLTTETDSPELPMKTSEEFEIEMTDHLKLICDSGESEFQRLIETLVCKGYCLIDNLYNKKEEEDDSEDKKEEEETPSSTAPAAPLSTPLVNKKGSVLQALRKTWSSSFCQSGWQKIKAFFSKCAMDSSYKVYRSLKQKGIQKSSIKTEKQFGIDLSKAGLLPFVRNDSLSKLTPLVHRLICQSYVAIDLHYLQVEGYEGEADQPF